MATFVKLKSGSWRAVVRHNNKYVSRTFLRKDDARGWAHDQERNIDQGRTPVTARAQRAQTFGDLIDLHIADMKEVGKRPSRARRCASGGPACPAPITIASKLRPTAASNGL